MSKIQIKSTQIKDLSIKNAQVASDAGIELTKIANSAELLKRDGSVALTGDLNANTRKITNLAAPTSANDAARKADVDALQNLKDAQTIYVAKNGNDSTGNGAERAPFLTINAALAAITDASPTNRYIIKVKAGSYTSATALNLKANVFVVGEHKDAVRISATSFGLDSSFSGSADNRSGYANVILLNACDFNWATVTSAAGKLYFSDVSFSSTVSMYGHNNAIAQAQFHNCMFFNTFTVSGINVGVHRNNIHYSNINLNQHPNGGMATILVADGGTCSGTVKLTTTVNDFNRRAALFARSFYSEYLTVDGPSSYADVTDNSVPRDIARLTKPNGGNVVYINTNVPIDSNTRNFGDVGRQYLYNFNYVNASTGTDLYVISMGTSYAADSSGKSIFIEADSYGLNADVNGGDINLNTATVSGTGVRGKVKINAKELDVSTSKIVNLANGVSSSDAVNKGQLDAVSSQVSSLDSSVVKLAKVVTREKPSGDIDDSNVVFTLASSPVTGTEQVYLNGLLQEPNDQSVQNDYSISGDTITFNFAPSAGDRLRVSYVKV